VAQGFPIINPGTLFEDTSASQWTNLFRTVATLDGIRVGEGLRLIKRDGTFRIELVKEERPIASGGNVFQQMKVSLVRDDYLDCQTAAQEAATPARFTSVAKPFLLRKASFHQQNVDGIDYLYGDPALQQRRAIKGQGSGTTQIVEFHEITPRYVPDHTLIVAARVADLGIKDTADEDVVWLSLDDPRVFAEIP